MYYTGIDLHKKTAFITTIDNSGKVVFRRNFATREEDLIEYFVSLDGPTKIVIESTCSWYWLHDLLKAHNFDVVISNPLKTKAIASAKIKNDKVDSHMLAQLLRVDLIATVHVCNACVQPKYSKTQRAAQASTTTGSGCHPHEESYPHVADEK